MSPLDAADPSIISNADHEPSPITLAAATACLVWYIAVAIVCTVGYVQM